MYHLDERVVEHHLWELGCALQRVCVCVCSFAQYLVFLPCLWTLETRRLMHVVGGSSKAQAESSQELQRRQERERQVDGFRVDSDSEALPKSAFHNLVSEQRFTDGQQVLGTQDKEDSSRAAVSKGGHRNFAEKWDSLHPTRAVLFQRRVLYVRLVKQCIIK